MPQSIDYPKFDKDAERELGVYVYALSDPRNGEVFYIGKGKADRWYQHVKAANDMNALELIKSQGLLMSPKIERIREIESTGQPVGVDFIRSGLPIGDTGDKYAFEIEAALIDFVELVRTKAPSTTGELTNLIAGQTRIGRARMSLSYAAKMYNAQPIDKIDEPVILLNLARTWNPEMSQEELWEYTRNAWKCSEPRRGKAQYALPVSHGIVRAGFRISGFRDRKSPDRNWEDDIDASKPRVIIECDHAPVSHPEMQKYVQKSVKALLTNRQWDFRYINC